MVEAIPVFENQPELSASISLDQLKDKCYFCVNINKKFWSPIDDGRGLKRMIYEAKDFKELIMLFK
jgi:hypothetical protein